MVAVLSEERDAYVFRVGVCRLLAVYRRYKENSQFEREAWRRVWSNCNVLVLTFDKCSVRISAVTLPIVTEFLWLPQPCTGSNVWLCIDLASSIFLTMLSASMLPPTPSGQASQHIFKLKSSGCLAPTDRLGNSISLVFKTVRGVAASQP